MNIKVDELSGLPAAAAEILEFLKSHNQKFVILRGEMGAGKTTLVKEIIKQMGAEDEGSSPTFSLVNEYFSVNYGAIYHFDFYRINDEEEALDIGIEEIFEEDAYVFIEWPERIENLIPQGIVSLSIKVENKTRNIELELV
ncbi:tRNA (adenosine(37)-N6)-threonylcarbamoyltransferase complex ATPase subunit type 1 TsaE [Paracrocinitomix mangrovi]|uniref:tRNA (adenosine(37)-N6)-threonylcarbamoyltransferase complex ATPase subunit type 1 TsaE n=1 Tax=Paracrocinitomix mangrovi TaxID=2862509 RepID=UPI001C8E27C6|nr:tRNA (adenosine(37)-N6)-threonylcarbamoyltransferase complex ATPase subunit type 1 TsaE [Paracrocinitomix mangrovi]UKN01550.1 tRNA (adenosine(37)-N6)-threonylcarbamoyltransferase complex ATPase subunit type 1 TsaE [Paracrocinitomix mangrovi]